jgi:hypothetical protein
MENDIKSSWRTWAWVIAGAVIAYVVYKKMYGSTSSGTSTTVVTTGSGSSTTTSGSASQTSSEASSIQSALDTYAQQDQAAFQAMGTAITNGFQSVLSGQTSLANGISAMFQTEATGIKSLFTSLNATIATEFQNLGTQITKVNSDLQTVYNETKTIESALAGDFGKITDSLTGIQSSLKSQQSSQATANAIDAGIQAYLAIKAALGGQNTTAKAMQAALPNCFTNGQPDFACIGNAILSGKVTIGQMIASGGGFQ